MTLTSNWRLTFDPAGAAIVLLAYDSEIDAEPSWPLRKSLDVVNLVDTDAPFLRPAGNNVVTFSFRVYSDETLDATARQRVMESLIAVAPLGRKPLKVEIKGITDRYWQFANAFITEHTPVRFMDAGTARIVKSWSVTATKLAQVGP